MQSLTGLPQGSIIILATMAFAGFAWTAGTPREPAQKCDDVRVIQYFAVPEPTPLIQTPPLGWPVLERQRAVEVDNTPTATVAADKQDDAGESPRRHYRRHHWRRRR